MLGLTQEAGERKVLDFDIENRPLSYWYDGRPTAEITSIASCWTDDPGSVEVLLLAPPCVHCIGGSCQEMGPGVMSQPEMLARFVERYNEADLVTGHFIRVHDLPIINGTLMEYGLPGLQPKMTSDTKLDMFKKGDIPATQEFLLEMLGVPGIRKYQMSQTKWREANRLTPDGLKQTYERVSSDIVGHVAMRRFMLQRELLKGPRRWRA